MYRRMVREIEQVEELTNKGPRGRARYECDPWRGWGSERERGRESWEQSGGVCLSVRQSDAPP